MSDTQKLAHAKVWDLVYCEIPDSVPRNVAYKIADDAADSVIGNVELVLEAAGRKPKETV